MNWKKKQRNENGRKDFRLQRVDEKKVHSATTNTYHNKCWAEMLSKSVMQLQLESDATLRGELIVRLRYEKSVFANFIEVIYGVKKTLFSQSPHIHHPFISCGFLLFWFTRCTVLI